MDPVTHGLIGAASAQLISDKSNIRTAAFAGFTSAILADLDVFIKSASDPLLNVEIHRQFTHSLLFIPVGALVATVLIRWFVRRKITFRQTYIFSLMGYATAGIADSMTSYGTQLLWPFLDERFAWNIISVFDPLFTAGILLALGLEFYHKTRRGSYLAFGWIFLYLSFGLFQHNRAEKTAIAYAEEKGYRIEQLVVKPSIGNQVLWGARYTASDSVFALGIRPGIFKTLKIYLGEKEELLDWREEFSNYKGTVLYEDIERFSKLSDDILIIHPEAENIIGDGRYSMLPTTMEPLWGVEIDTAKPHQHLNFLNFRNAGEKVRSDFLRMLKGEDLN